MSRKPVPAQHGQRARVEVNFDRPQLLPQLFGEYDSNILALEERLGVYIHARGQRVVIEGSAEAVAHAREVLIELHSRVIRGEAIDPGLIDAVIAMSTEPMLTGIVRAENDAGSAPPIMIRTRNKTIVPRSLTQTTYMRALVSNDIIFALGPAGTG
jgi:phosphate starvation-inducible PhoH-like protein